MLKSDDINATHRDKTILGYCLEELYSGYGKPYALISVSKKLIANPEINLQCNYKYGSTDILYHISHCRHSLLVLNYLS